MAVIRECVRTIQLNLWVLFVCMCVMDVVYVSLIRGRCYRVKLNSWHWEGRDHAAHPLLCQGTGFLLASLDPLIVCPGRLLVNDDKGRGVNQALSWVTGAKVPPPVHWFDSDDTSRAGMRQTIQKQAGDWRSNGNQLSNYFIGNSNKWWVTRCSSSFGVKQQCWLHSFMFLLFPNIIRTDL